MTSPYDKAYQQVASTDTEDRTKPLPTIDKPSVIVEYFVGEGSTGAQRIRGERVGVRSQLSDTSDPNSAVDRPAVITNLEEPKISDDGGTNGAVHVSEDSVQADPRKGDFRQDQDLKDAVPQLPQNATDRSRLATVSLRGDPDASSVLAQQAKANKFN